ncbi:uncharacterized protein LOC128554324 [Mercenaria mercenaria]|uniref:uncharacterized protein LOC128554324 n=1 Tax=Mercenaria mercenaria TaxID=6596 RepID=UPI00234F8814|nr:uncharacterized protein LOC128554324 [Mercenaria mercenaria]
MTETERSAGDKMNVQTKFRDLVHEIETLPFCIKLFQRYLITHEEMNSIHAALKSHSTIDANVELLNILNTKDIKKSVMANILGEVDQHNLLAMFYPPDDTDVVQEEKEGSNVFETYRSTAEEMNLKKRFPDLVQYMYMPTICVQLHKKGLITCFQKYNINVIYRSYGNAQANRELLQKLSTKSIEKSVMLEIVNNAHQLHLFDMFYPSEDTDVVQEGKKGLNVIGTNRGSAEKMNFKKRYPDIVQYMNALTICDQLYSKGVISSLEMRSVQTEYKLHDEAHANEKLLQILNKMLIEKSVFADILNNAHQLHLLDLFYPQDNIDASIDIEIKQSSAGSKEKKTFQTYNSGASTLALETILQDSNPDDNTIKIHFDAPPKREEEDIATCRTSASDIVEILANHSFKTRYKIPKMVEFASLSFGQKRMACTFSTQAFWNIKQRLGDRYTPRLACVSLMKSYLHYYNINKDDFEFEKNAFARLVILDYICYALVRSHQNIVEAYPSSKDSTILLIAFTIDVQKSSDFIFNGFQVCCKSYYVSSYESISAENYAQEKDLHCPLGDELLNGVILSNTKLLFTNHSNLEGIGSSMVRSTKNGYDTTAPCVVLYCRYKSYIPYGEQRFPEFLTHSSGISFKTDVRDGYFSFGTNGNTLQGAATEWHKEVAMGCSVGPKSGQYDATIGPFVKVDGIGETCFLTVRHMFQPFDLDDRRLQGTKLMQPADGDTKPDPYSQTCQRGPGNDRECGEVLMSVFNERVDAAVVKIKADRSPSRGYFVVPRENELKFAGFSHTNFPAFDDGSVMDARTFTTENFASERVIKFGKVTGLTKGSLELDCTAVKVVDEEKLTIEYNGRTVSKVMQNQLKINSHSLKTFFHIGDSGSAVFLVDKQNKLHCIGMAIGLLSDLSCLVTPIQVVLSELEKKLSKKILLEDFKMENME